MRDHIESLRRVMLRLSRVPGLGFLRDHAQSMEMTKATIETRLSGLEAEKQGVEEGLDVVSSPFRRNSKAGSQSGSGPAATARGGTAAGTDPASGSSTTPRPPAASKSKRQAPTRAEIRAQKKLLQRKLRG